MEIQFAVLTGSIGLFIAISGFYVGRLSNAQKAGVRDGKLDTTLEYMKSAIDEIKAELKETNLSALRTDVEALKVTTERHTRTLERLGNKLG